MRKTFSRGAAGVTCLRRGAVRTRRVCLPLLAGVIMLACAVLPGGWGLLPGFAEMPGVSGVQGAMAATANATVTTPAAPSVTAPKVAAPKSPSVPAVSGPAAPKGAAARPAPASVTGQEQGQGKAQAHGEPSLSDMIGQMFMVGFRGAQAQAAALRAGGVPGLGKLLRPGAVNAVNATKATNAAPPAGNSTYGVNEVLADIRAGRVGGVILFDRDLTTGSPERNIISPKQVRALSAALQAAASASPAGLPLFVAVDQEGGRVQRLKPERGFTQYPPARQLGQGTVDETRLRAVAMGRELADAGVNLNFAPVVDVDVNPDSPAIGRLGRAYGRDPRAVAAHAAAFVNGMAQAGVVSCLKHFPGHGSARADSHLGVTDVSATRRPEELWPYRALLRPAGNAWADGWGGMVMVGHLYDNRLDAAHPATLSRAAIDGLLRRDMGWRGVVVTDDLQMGAITDRYPLEEVVFRAVDAGADILLFGNNLRWQPDLAARAHATLTGLVHSGRISEDRIRQSYQRIARLKGLLRAGDATLAGNGLAMPELPDLPDVGDATKVKKIDSGTNAGVVLQN
ncbi:glycoside hydrolase family 3 N-terminal domain-containing protein [Nitratidesulfovibrio sp. 1201_IL3209]|uniref:glycoside hydrolase family 3 N-terminal domain-containing protein n=1 Tax=Nitratidesulfovibrio sp. 1201_IL3209 TaxID=3084053 RepID=UPI002FD9FCEE